MYIQRLWDLECNQLTFSHTWSGAFYNDPYLVRMCEVFFSFVGIVSGKVAGVTWISDLENNDDNKE